MKPGGNEPGPDGDGKWRPDGPIPGDGARLGGVARPKPESVSSHGCMIRDRERKKKKKYETFIMAECTWETECRCIYIYRCMFR